MHHLTPADGVRVHFYRAVVPSYYEFHLHDTVIALEPKAPLRRRPSDSAPYSAALLRFSDNTASNHSEAQALASELAAFLTLIFDRRVDVATELALSDGAKIHFLGYSASVDRRLIGPLPENLRPVFDDAVSRLTSLESADLEVLDAASRLHHASTLLCERDIASAYVLLVAALEVLSCRYGKPPQNWEDWADAPSWDDEFQRLELTAEQEMAVRLKLLANQHIRLKLTFLRYVTESLPNDFWDGQWEEWAYGFHLNKDVWLEPTVEHKSVESIIPKNRELLRKALGKTYDLRSGIVHRGTELHLHQTSLRAQVAISPDDPVPYPVLRAIVVALTKHEWFSRSAVSPLPKWSIPK
jgi:hypothetical protein